MKKTNNPNTSRNNQLSGNERIVNRTNQRRKKNKRKKLIFRAVLCFVFLCIGIIFALTMFFNISEITVTGDTIYSSEDVIEKSGVIIGDNLIFVSKKEINEKVSTGLPYVGSVKVKRHLPTKLELIITKTDAVYAVVIDGYYTLLDETGKVLEKDLEYVGDNIILLNIGEIKSSEPGKKISLKPQKCFEIDETELNKFEEGSKEYLEKQKEIQEKQKECPDNHKKCLDKCKEYLEKLITLRETCADCGIKDITAIDLSDIYDIKLTYQGRIILELGETNNDNLYKKLSLGKAAIDTQNEENMLYRGIINLTVDGKGYWSEETSTTEPQTEVESTTTDTSGDENTIKPENAELTTASAA